MVDVESRGFSRAQQTGEEDEVLESGLFRRGEASEVSD